MTAFTDYLAKPSKAGGRELGRLAAYLVEPTRYAPEPAEPAGLRHGHRAEYLASYAIERLRLRTMAAQDWDREEAPAVSFETAGATHQRLADPRGTRRLD